MAHPIHTAPPVSKPRIGCGVGLPYHSIADRLSAKRPHAGRLRAQNSHARPTGETTVSSARNVIARNITKGTDEMEISTERKGSVLVATTEERIDGVNARAFQDALQAAIEDTDRAVIIDLSQLTYISSAGLRVILLIARTLQRQDGNLAVCSLSDPVLEVFQISGFDQIIKTYGTQEEAVSALTS